MARCKPGTDGTFSAALSDVARLTRVIAVDVPPHVTQLGNARQFILAGDADRRVYLDLLRRYSQLHQKGHGKVSSFSGFPRSSCRIVCRPSGTGSMRTPDPGLTPWAALFRTHSTPLRLDSGFAQGRLSGAGVRRFHATGNPWLTTRQRRIYSASLESSTWHWLPSPPWLNPRPQNLETLFMRVSRHGNAVFDQALRQNVSDGRVYGGSLPRPISTLPSPSSISP